MTAKYLARYADPQATLVAQDTRPLPVGPFGHVVVIPVMGEGAQVFDTLASIPGNHTLVIIVCNARATAERWVHARNAALRRLMAQRFGPGSPWGTRPGDALYAAPFGHLLWLDHAPPHDPLPDGQGVGLARKIGCDMALALMQRGAISSPWIACTDADVLLPNDYFAQLHATGSAVAATFAYVHVPDPDPALADAIVRYEASLRYYVCGLRYAKSPYAYHTIGSTIAVRGAAYAQVRGFGRLNAAEDFYLLDKLRKVGPVASLFGAPIQISGRVSSRVPFGTGRAMLNLVTGVGQKDFYHPHTFELLRGTLQALDAGAHDADAFLPAVQKQGGTQLAHMVQAMGLTAAVQRSHRDTRHVATRRRNLHTWFDSLRTLRFVHTLRDTILPTQPALQAAAAPPFSCQVSDCAGLVKALARLEVRSYLQDHG